MGPTWWVLVAAVMSALELTGVLGYVAEPLSTLRPKSSPVERDDSAIYFPDDFSTEYTGLKRSLSDDAAPARFSDLYPQTSFFNAERPPGRDLQPAAHGPQSGWGNPAPQWGNSGFNNPPRRPNRPNWGGGGNQPWGNSGGNFDGTANNDYDEIPFVFDRPPTNGGNSRPQPGNGGGSRPPPGNGGGSRPQPGNGGGSRPPPGNSGVARPQPGNGGGSRPQPGNSGVARPQPNQPRPGNNGGGGRPRPSSRPPATPATTTPRAAATTTTRPVPGAPVTAPTPAPTRPGCNCPSTPEFNPVCGQDRVTYNNPGKLRCANACGNNVQMLHFGACITTTTPAPSR